MYPLHATALHTAFVGLGTLAGVAVFAAGAARAGIVPLRALAVSTVTALAALAGARLHWLLEQGSPNDWADPFGSGVRHPGGILVAIVALPIARRLLLPGASLRRLLDVAAPSAAVALAAVRVGCFLAGCCFGTRCDLPWAVRFPEQSPAALLHHFHDWVAVGAQGSAPVHPLQLYFLALALALAGLLWWFDRRRAYDGQVFLLFVAFHETGKYLLEMLREPELGVTTSSVPILSLAMGAAAWLVLALAAARRRPTTGAPAAWHAASSGSR